MKNKFLHLILALAMALLLCACGQTANQPSPQITDLINNVRDGAAKLNSTENCQVVLQVSINPQLELYLDETGTVLKVAAINNDAQQLLNALQLEGISLGDAMGSILGAAKEQGFFDQDSTIQIDVLASASGPLTLDQTRQLIRIITDYDPSLAASVNQHAVVAAHCGATTMKSEVLENGDQFYSYYDDSGLVREICYGADGAYTEWRYQGLDTTDTYYISPNGARHEEHYTYYQAGVKKDWKSIWIDGTSVQEELAVYHENGTLKEHTITHSDTDYYEYIFESFHPNGNPKTKNHMRTTEQEQDESCEEYNANGKLITGTSKRSVGDEVEESFTTCEYHPNGELKVKNYTSSTNNGQEESYEEYNANGTLKTKNYSLTTGNEHYESQENYNEDGNLVTGTYKRITGDEVEESFTACEYHPNGKLKTENNTWTSSNKQEESFKEFFENGNPKTVTHSWVDGDNREYSHTEYYENGRQKTIMHSQVKGNLHEESMEEYYEDGKLKARNHTKIEGNTREEHSAEYYPNGSIKTELYTIIQDGRTEKNLYEYYESGNRKTLKHTLIEGKYQEESTEEYNEDGTVQLRIAKMTQADGSFSEVHIDANGNRLYLMDVNDGVRRDIYYTYYPSGAPKTQEQYFTNSDQYISILYSYTEDGNIHMVEHRKDGSTKEYFYDKNWQPIQ